MRKLIWVSWCLLLLAFVASYFRTAAFDYQLTPTIWIQVGTAGGGARLVVVSGDPSASWTANTVIERDKNTWRYDVSTAPWGRVTPWVAPVDTLGTMVSNFRVDVPLIGPLLIPLVIMLALWSMKRWGAPPRLVWAELWRTPQFDRAVFGIFRRVLLVVSIVFVFGAALVWAGSYLDPLPRWRYLGDHLALVTGRSVFDLRSLNLSGAGPNAFANKLAELIDEHRDEIGQPERYFSVEITRARIAFRYFRADVPSGTTALSVSHEFGGFGYSQDRVEMPDVASPFPSKMFRGLAGTNPGPGATAGLERTVILRLWALIILFGLWPLLCFLRGPLRRARRRAAGCCPPCGYNLTGLSDPRCPECGTAFDPNLMHFEHRADRHAWGETEVASRRPLDLAIQVDEA